MKNQINHFRSKSESRVGTLNIKIPEAIKYRMDRELREQAIKDSVRKQNTSGSPLTESSKMAAEKKK